MPSRWEHSTQIPRTVNGDPTTLPELADRARAALSSGDFSSIPPELNRRIHRLLIAEGSERYGELIRLIADPRNRPLVFHCSHGVHRTGTAAAILLALLGVDWPVVRTDYLAGNRPRRATVTTQLASMRGAVAETLGVSPGDVDMTNMEAFMVQDGSYIDASRDEVLEHYATFEEYARTALSCSGDLIDSLREQLIHPGG